MAENTERETKKLPFELFDFLRHVPTEESIAAEASDLHRAAVTGDTELLRQTLDSKQCDINLLDKRGHTPLFTAAKKGGIASVELLISRGAKLNNCGDESYINTNPMHCARDVSTLRILLKAGGDINAKESKGNTPLHRAVMREDECIALYLLEHGADVNSKDNEGCSALHICCSSSESENMVNIMKHLIVRGADVNAADHFGLTPLHYCAKGRCSKLAVKTLVSYGGNLQMHDYRGNCPVHYFRLYLEEDEDNFIETLREFFPSPETGSVIDMKGQTPLHLATDTSANVIATLLECGCDVNARDNHGKTSLHIASGMKKGSEITQNLIANGGNVNTGDEWGRTPLHEAASAGNNDIAKLLISRKADVNAIDICGCTPLHESCTKDECEVAETLIKNGAIVNKADANGSTALHFAAWGNSEGSIDKLLKNGAKTDLKDTLGQTPLDVAIYRKAESAVRNLETNTDEKNISSKTEENSDSLYSFSNCGGELLAEENVKNMIENKEVFRKGHTDLESYLGHILESSEIGRGCDDDEAIEIQQAMEDLVQHLADIIGKKDWRFRCKLIHAGSTSEGTKTRRPDEFDYIFALEEFSKHCSPVFVEADSEFLSAIFAPPYYPSKNVSSDSRPACVTTEMSISVSDYAFMEFNKSPETAPFIHFAGSTTMPVYKMYDGFSQLLTKVVFSRDFPKNPKLLIKETTLDPAITLRWRGCRYKDLEISADLVPAIILRSWPDQFSRDRKILTPDILCLPTLVVPKMTAGIDEDLWRCSLALEETAIFRKLRPEVRNSYITCKALISSLFCPLIDFGGNEEILAFYKMEHDSLPSDEEFTVHDEAEAIVPSYMLKMMFLAAVESKAERSGKQSVYVDYNEPLSSEEIEGDQHNTKTTYGPAQFMNMAKKSCDLDVQLVLDVFRRCEDCIERKFVPSFFNPRHNVLGSRVMKEDAGKVALFIKFIRCLLES